MLDMVISTASEVNVIIDSAPMFKELGPVKESSENVINKKVSPMPSDKSTYI